MAAVLLGAVAGVRVRETGLNRAESSWWLRQYALDPPPEQLLTVTSLYALRTHLDAHLRTQLGFFIKVKFDMEVFLPGWGAIEPGVGAERIEDHYLLQPSPWLVTPNGDPDRRMRNIVETARLKLEQHLESARLRNSREMIGGIKHIYVLVSPGMQMSQLPPAPVFGEDLQMGAPHPHPLPEELVAKKCFWNPRTEDFSCFSWCVRAHLAEVHKLPDQRPKTSTRLTDEVFYRVPPARGKYSKQAKRELEDFGLNWSTLPDPSQRGVCWTDIAEFERANGGLIHVHVWDWCRQEVAGKSYFERHLVREPTYGGPKPRHEVHLLRLDAHYVLIHNMSAFFSSQGRALDGSRSRVRHVCHRCRCGFRSAENLARHQQQPCSFDPGQRKAVLRMPDVSKRQHLVRYKPGPSAEFCPLVVYSDLEAFSDPVPQAAEDLHSVQRRVASLAFRAVTRNGFELPTGEMVYLTRAEAGESEHAVVERYLRFLLRVGKRYLLWKKTTNVPARPTAAEWEEHQAATKCARCDKAFVEGCPRKGKVLHHRHGTGEYIETLCGSCNRAITQAREVPVVFHNGGNYDFKFLIRTIAFLRREAEPQDPDSDEEPQEADSDEELEPQDSDSLELDEEVDFKKLHFSVLFKTSEKMLQVKLGNLVFRDSINFYNSGLDKLMDNLAKTAPDGNLAAVFPHVAATHPELQPEALTVERRVLLRKHFAPEKSDCTEEDYWKWTWSLLLRKLPMPFKRMQSTDMWSMPAVWADEAYESELKTVKAEEIALLRETAAIMGWSTFQQVHDCYLHMDLCLADVMEAFRTAFFSKFGLDPLQYVTLPSAAYDAMLKSCLTQRPARLITDSGIYRTVRSSIMGGLSCAFQTYAKANSPELGPGKWNEDEDRSYLLQMDISSMYPYIMTMPMPASSGETLSLPEGRAERLAWVKQQLAEIDFKRSDETECLLFVVDFSFPCHLHDYLDWAPPCKMTVEPELLSEYSRKVMQENGLTPGKVAKLVPFLGRHCKEGVDGKRLAFMVQIMGARIERVHEAIRFKCAPFLSAWMKGIYDERLLMKKQKRTVEAEMLKLVMNAIYGKLIQNVEGFKNSQVYTSSSSFVRAANGRRMQDMDVFFGEGEFLGVVHSVDKQVRQKSLVQAGWRVLELSRLQMLMNHYLGMKHLFPDAVVTLTDTDSAHYYIKADKDPLLELALANEDEPGRWPCFFDLAKDLVHKSGTIETVLSHLTASQLSIARARAGELGGFGVEHLPRRVWEEINLRAKLYSTRFNNDADEQKSKGIVKRARPKHEAYRETMATGLEQAASFSVLQSRQFILAVAQLSKKALSPLNDKVFQVSALENRPLGHWRNHEMLAKVAEHPHLGIESLAFQRIMIFLLGRPDVVR